MLHNYSLQHASFNAENVAYFRQCDLKVKHSKWKMRIITVLKRNTQYARRISHKTLSQLLSRCIATLQHDNDEGDNGNEEHSNDHSECDNN